MKFFTDKTVVNDYLLIKIKDYLKLDDFSRWKEVFIDPGVYELTKSDRYSWEGKIIINDFLHSLPKNHYFSWDYPCDMNKQHTDLFIKKSWYNAQLFHLFPQYIITVQFKYNDYLSFVEWFDKYNNLSITSGILAIGNICRFLYLNEFAKHALDYAFSHCRHPRIHIYGLGFRMIKYANDLAIRYNIDFSIDNTKWTRACSQELKDKYEGRVGCRKHNRQEFFDEYMKKIDKFIKE